MATLPLPPQTAHNPAPCIKQLKHGLPAPVTRFVAAHEVYQMTGTPHTFLGTQAVAARLGHQDWQQLKHTDEQLNQALKHGDPQHTMGRIMALLAHFFITPLPEKLHSAVFKDWLHVLTPYPNWAINTACEHWIATQSKKPFPRDIVQRTRTEIAPFLTLKEALNLLFHYQQTR